MGCSLCPSAPPAPDYAAAATAQGAANVDTALAQGALNNPNMVTPYGTSTYSPLTADQIKAGLRPTLTQTLSPAEQQKLEQSNAIQNASLGILGQDMPNIANALLKPFGMQGGPTQGYLPGTGPGRAQTDANWGSAGGVQSALDFSGTPGIPVANADVRNQVARSIFDQGAALLNPMYRDRQQQLDSQLANQGIVMNPTTDQNNPSAWERAQDALHLQQMKDYTQLANSAVSGGGDAMAQLFGMQLGGQQQAVGQLEAQGQFANQAQQQAFNNIAQAMQNRNAGIGLQGQLASNEAGLYNQGRGQAYNEYTTNQTMPLNMLNAMLSSSQVNNPQFQPTQPTSIAPPPIMQGAQLQGQANAAGQNAQAGITGGILGAGAKLGAAAIPYIFSDRRIKENIERIGTFGGHKWYKYDLGGKPQVGVMAQDVEKRDPSAVLTMPFGLKAVDYSKVV